MLKKTTYFFSFITLLITSSSIFAFSLANPLCDKRNLFYFSKNIGILQSYFNQSYIDQTDLIPQNIRESVQQNGYTGGIGIGYTRVLAPTYSIGAEFSANTNFHENARFASGASTAAFTDKTALKYNFDLVAVPALFLSESLLGYLKLGVSFGDLTNVLVSPGGFIPVSSTYHSSAWVAGFAASVGARKFITNHFSLFSEVTYHDYGSNNFDNFLNFTANYSHSADVKTCALNFGAIYQL